MLSEKFYPYVFIIFFQFHQNDMKKLAPNMQSGIPDALAAKSLQFSIDEAG